MGESQQGESSHFLQQGIAVSTAFLDHQTGVSGWPQGKKKETVQCLWELEG